MSSKNKSERLAEKNHRQGFTFVPNTGEDKPKNEPVYYTAVWLCSDYFAIILNICTRYRVLRRRSCSAALKLFTGLILSIISSVGSIWLTILPMLLYAILMATSSLFHLQRLYLPEDTAKQS